MLNEDVTCKFLRYIAVDTASDETTGTSPSTAGQFDLAKLLISELKEIGIPGEDIFFDSDHCYIYCRIKKQKFPLVLDFVMYGLLVGQIMGRWGNFSQHGRSVRSRKTSDKRIKRDRHSR